MGILQHPWNHQIWAVCGRLADWPLAAGSHLLQARQTCVQFGSFVVLPVEAVAYVWWFARPPSVALQRGVRAMWSTAALWVPEGAGCLPPHALDRPVRPLSCPAPCALLEPPQCLCS